MAKKIKSLVLLLGVYLLVFWIGFKSGAIYLRMQNKIQVEKVVIVETPAPLLIVEERDLGSHQDVTFTEADQSDVIVKMSNNDKLCHLLKLKNIKIYKSTGEQVY